MRPQDQYQRQLLSSFAKTAMAYNGSLSNIHEIESRWNTPLDAMWNLSILIVLRPISEQTIASTLELVATKIATKATGFSTRMNVTRLAGP